MQLRILIGTIVVVGFVFAGLAAAALILWPKPLLRADPSALARVSLPGYAGRVSQVAVTLADGTRVPVATRGGRVWPLRTLPSGAELTVEVTTHAPFWAGWLVGSDRHEDFTMRTPTAQLRGTWLQIPRGGEVGVSFNVPVGVVSLAGKPAQKLSNPRAFVPTGLLASGSHSAGTILVAAAARSWEQLPPPVRVTWFPALAEPQVLSAPRPGTPLAPGGKLTLTFSRPVSDVLGSALPQLSPVTRGSWRLLDAHTLSFTPRGGGFGLGADVQLELPRGVILAGESGAALTRTLSWQVPVGSTLRLQQLLAQLGYLPLDWQPSTTAPGTARSELAAAISAPAGHFSWRYPNTPQELQALWFPGQPNEITRGAVMMFEHNSGLSVDGIAGPEVWKQLLADTVAGTGHQSGYSYVYVHRSLPQSLNLWVDGQTILSSPGNTGVPAAPTRLGTYPVFEHIPIGTMSGRNPDGSHYHDPGIRWISYFHGGDAIHSFNRASYGTPQSLGCVELPLASAALVWPHTPIGTLVTIEN